MELHKILVVDDDPEMRLALKIRLRANNYDVLTAVDGVSAIAEARKHTPDLILLDLGLPAGDGFTVLDRLQAIPDLAQIPVLVVSGRNRLINEPRALQSGAALFLQKPVKNTDLLQAIAQSLGKTAHPAADPTPTIYDLSL